MFDPATASILRSAPALPGLNPDDLPLLLTGFYAELVSARLRGGKIGDEDTTEDEWSLEKIADAYELITSVQNNNELRRASAFVAATAQQILARKQVDLSTKQRDWNISHDHVDPTIAATLLFLAAEQYADAHEATASITLNNPEQLYEVTIISEHIRDLGRGHLTAILDRAMRRRKEGRDFLSLDTSAFVALIDALNSGIELFAAEILSQPVPDNGAGRFGTSRQAFVQALELSSRTSRNYSDDLGGDLNITYSGPRHLSSLLIAAHDGICDAALTKVQPPEGSDPDFWKSWIDYRAQKCPFIWPNHRDAIRRGFHQTGKSAVMVLPTGAGKTTVSSLKIAGVLARGKKVVFLVPTHALVDQLTNDIQEMFPKNLFGSVVSSDFDLLLQSGIQIQEVEVMTPERCLAMLSFAPDTFVDVGLLVFDECHLLSPQSGKIRRALDGMLCVLAFNKIVPEADTLFLSAMIKNGEEFSHWISALVGRDCVCVDLLWKPSRQARGVIIYKSEELKTIVKKALQVQKLYDRVASKPTIGLRKSAENELNIQPFAIWGLQHNWLQESTVYCIFTPVLEGLVHLNGKKQGGRLRLTPNSNEVAAKLASSAARNNLKTIVFVNQKAHAVSTARKISDELGEVVEASESELSRWNALQKELGDLKHSILDGPSVAVPHNASMLRLERELAERMFRRPNGAKVIVATPTLAQGLNLPAELAILAGDKRADEEGREDLEAHEILNAAARAGRAGHLANGVVLLVPEPIISFSEEPLSAEVVSKLQSVLPEDDHCVVISDPLEVVLDRIMQGEVLDRDVQYTINRMSAVNGSVNFEDSEALFNLKRSYGAYFATQANKEAEFEAKLAALKEIVAINTPEAMDTTLAFLASQSGLPVDLLLRLRNRITQQIGLLPTSVEGWTIWTIDWLREDQRACSLLLFDSKRSILASVGIQKDGELTPEVLTRVLPGIRAWILGQPICEIETKLGGNPDSGTPTLSVCPRARELVSNVIPRGISFILGLVSHVVKQVNPFRAQEDVNIEVVECLGTAVRRGFDTVEKLNFAKQNEHLLSRVVMHEAYALAQRVV